MKKPKTRKRPKANAKPKPKLEKKAGYTERRATYDIQSGKIAYDKR